MSKLVIHNFRAGFATNSSSSHSIVLIPNSMVGKVSEIDPCSDYGYGWDDFRLVTTEQKLRYLAAQFFTNLSDLKGTELEEIVDRFDQEIPGYKQELIDKNENLFDGEREYGDLPYVDHQSVLRIKNYDRSFVEDMIKFFKSDRVVVLGGNDNDDHDDHLIPEAQSAHFLHVLQTDDKSFIFRKDGNYTVGFNPNNGTKVRFSFQDEDYNGENYVKATYPELVDLKITNYCAGGCKFCLTEDAEISIIDECTSLIKDIKVGDVVLGYDSETGTQYTQQIIETYIRDYEGDLIDIELENGKTISITPEHEIFVLNRGWIKAEDCFENDHVLTIRTDEAMRIKSIKRRKYSGKVYNIATDPHHNYFANGMLVHNCYMSSTTEGKHASFEQINNALTLLANMGVFEVAIGGGEPTDHPDFAKILRRAGELCIKPNFTTMSDRWLDNKEIVAAVNEMVGGIGVSCQSVKDLARFDKIDGITNWRTNVMVQHVAESVPLEVTMTLINKCFADGNPLLLLGYKEVGFGAQYNPHRWEDPDSVAVRVKCMVENHSDHAELSVDTAIVNQHPELLKALGVPEALITSPEGKFSCYIDAGEQIMGPSSYVERSDMIPLVDTVEEFAKVFQQW